MNSKEPNYKDYDGNNAAWIIVFNPDNEKTYLSTSVSFQEYTGVLVFGDQILNNDLVTAYKDQMKERYGEAE
ncbi:MAG: hypothetical protein FH758_00825 [Firmicutes bacterium]|nr:hypothetical protein [Bacillota bacterium]